jgi:hypothetical protein
MRKWLFLGLLAGLSLAAGCATVTQTPAQNRATTAQIWELELREMADDWNLMWMTNRPNRLTRWQTR